MASTGHNELMKAHLHFIKCLESPFQIKWHCFGKFGKILTLYQACNYLSMLGLYLTHCYHIFSVVVCLRCVLYHILSLIAYTFQENRDFVFIIIVQFMMSSNSSNTMSSNTFWLAVFVCLYITPSHYHHCANLSEDIELIKCLSDICCRVSEWDLAYSLSYPLYNIWGCAFSVYPSPLWWLREYFTLSYYHHQIGSMNYSPLFKVRSWNNGMRCMSLYF